MLSNPGPDESPRSAGDPLARFAICGVECVVVAIACGDDAADAQLGTFRIGGASYAVIGDFDTAAHIDPIEVLTPRELEIALLVAAGFQAKEIAQRLRISFHTVRVHVGRIYAKLQLHKQTELAARIGSRFGCARDLKNAVSHTSRSGRPRAER